MRISDWISDLCSSDLERLAQIRVAAQLLGDEVWRRFPWSCGEDGGFVLPMTTAPEQALLNRHWNPTLSVTGAEGLPPVASAGNVLRPRSAFKLSLRLPPLVDAVAAAQELKRSEEHTSELQSLMRISYAVFCLQKKKQHTTY